MSYPLKRPVTRRLECFVRDAGLRRLVVTLHPSGMIELRPERTRRSETAVLSDLWARAVKERVIRERAERKAKRKRQ